MTSLSARIRTRPHVSGLGLIHNNECRLMLHWLLALGHMWAKEILPHDVRELRKLRSAEGFALFSLSLVVQREAPNR